ncbi:E3 ubiquitin/ISG15 ligase TRIM25-like [Esox lucius]|uniref:Tripartite motif containing 25 n=1 Tax=Esox lucius TaxID=8010 RepID=A0A3P8XE58_ESOLU|nr:E3 ubiquitin/ISG15 ligase TRIM25-like [Esox lucius]XP_010887770.2 E3 ubiquitin/ISG15 ligase TRIM25-like [Esox lucius]XP_019900073.2 E3 ubiquitin/ISG15 ligase TRIM25-like [Esox lucius]XP_019900078.2 E3 ubiquitin/ISG15 ligase TRIM25-like [Esox lucius]
MDEKSKCPPPEKSQLEVMLTCPVCQDIFKEPRQLPCGHSFCMVCLDGMVDFGLDTPFRCPDCRAYFGVEIRVQKNYALANIAEDYRESLKAKNPGIVYCDCCPEEQSLAVKTCLKCEVSLCQDHLQHHLLLPAYMGHPLVKPLGDLDKRRCPVHEDAVLKYYCSMSKTYICNICAMDKKQMNLTMETNNLGRKLKEFMEQQFQVLEGKLQECKDSIRKLKEDLNNEMSNPNDSSINTVTVVLLCLWFIALYYAYSFSVENQNLTDSVKKQQTLLYNVYSSMAEYMIDSPLKGLSNRNSREGNHALTLDVDSASPFLMVSPDLQSVERLGKKQTLHDHPSRFNKVPQVLTTQCHSSGRHYWEVEVEGYWDIAVSYKSIRRKGTEGPAFGLNKESWSITHNDKGNLFAYHNKIKRELARSLKGNRVAVMVDFENGTITFFEVDLKNTKLHQFNAELSQPVCLGFGLYKVDPPSRVTII